MIDKTKPMPTLLLGGPADGKRIALEAGTRTYRHATISDAPVSRVMEPVAHDAPLEVADTYYAIGTMRGTFGEIFYVGLCNLNDDPIELLLRGYRRPDTSWFAPLDLSKTVTLLGGPGDGKRCAGKTSDQIEYDDGRVLEFYKVVPLVGKDQQLYHVGLLDPLTECPIKLLIEGYRLKVPA